MEKGFIYILFRRELVANDCTRENWKSLLIKGKLEKNKLIGERRRLRSFLSEFLTVQF
jgi:hypothetical protein